ncbi:MAG: alpha/beta hydrolase [Luteitalea sp.]
MQLRAALLSVILATASEWAGSVTSGATRGGLVAPVPAVRAVQNPTSGLPTLEVGNGRDLLVLLHGYGSSPEEWLQLTSTIQLPGSRRFVFPQGPTRAGRSAGRAWWLLDLASHRGSDGLPDLSRVRPGGLAPAAALVRQLLIEAAGRIGSPRGHTMLGGYSQGGMLAAEVAFDSPQPLEALILLSPTIVDEARWRQGLWRRRGLPVFIAHGRRDPVLSFRSSERLQRLLRDAGLRVLWLPFDGGHEIPSSVVIALTRFVHDPVAATAD